MLRLLRVRRNVTRKKAAYWHITPRLLGPAAELGDVVGGAVAIPGIELGWLFELLATHAIDDDVGAVNIGE